MSSRTTRRALSSRQVNVDNNNINNNGKSSSSSILPSKKDSRLLLQRSGSTASSTTSSAATNVNDKGFSSLSSDTLRRAISTGSSNTADTADHGAGLAMKSTKSKQQPLGISTKHQNRTNIPTTKSSSTTKPTTSSSSSSEPITIVEHRKRPSGDGYTVHKYLRGKLLGKGGFAKVYKVTSLDTNKEYAVKIVPKANLVKSRARQKVCFVCAEFYLVVCVMRVFVGSVSHASPPSPQLLTQQNSYKLKSKSIDQ